MGSTVSKFHGLKGFVLKSQKVQIIHSCLLPWEFIPKGLIRQQSYTLLEKKINAVIAVFQ